MAAQPLRIDFVSDVACPWCAVGLWSLDRALERVGDEIAVELHFEPFELNPSMPPEGEDATEHLSRKYGAPPEQLAKNRAVIRERGAEVGFAFGDRPRVWNTFDAHRLLHWAELDGSALQLKDALFKANFTDLWTPHPVSPIKPDLGFIPAVAANAGAFGLLVALCVSQVGSRSVRESAGAAVLRG